MEEHREPSIRWFLEAGIDDLSKYRVVELIVRAPGVCGGVDFFSETLGLQPRALVAERLEELARHGVLDRRGRSSTLCPLYSITSDGATRRRLLRLFRLASEPGIRAALFGRLARESLRKASTRAKHRAPRSKGQQSAVEVNSVSRPRHATGNVPALSLG